MRIAIVSSRIGHDVARHRGIAIALCHAALDAQQRQATWLIAAGSAIEPWAIRAAARFQIPVQTFVADQDRDAAVIHAADQIHATYVRRGGKIAAAIHLRLQAQDESLVRVVIWPSERTAAEPLIAAGAVGIYLPEFSKRNHPTKIATGAMVRVTPPPGDWLVHCTRGRVGGWPEQSDDDYRDEILSMSAVEYGDRTPLDALDRIVHERRLIASAVATNQATPVVCFSALPLDELLHRRTFRSHLSRWDYEPYGIMIRRDAAIEIGIEAVVYGPPSARDALSADQRYRFHPVGTTSDWTAEKEWRMRGDVAFDRFDQSDWRVFALGNDAARQRLQRCLDKVVWVDEIRADRVKDVDIQYVCMAFGSPWQYPST